MFDLHCHVLYSIDDGAKDLEDSLNICTLSSASGVKGICATPHYIDGDSEVGIPMINEYLDVLNDDVKKKGLDLIVYPGMEVFITSNLLELYEKGRILCINNTKYMLIELPLFNSLPNYLYDVLFNLEVKGIKPIIAHPERCKAIIDSPNTVYRLIERGCLMQINAGSITGPANNKVKHTADILLDHNLVHAVASDTHSSKGRIHSLSDAYEIVSKKHGKSYADELFIANPEKIINGQDLDIKEPEKIKKKKFLIF